MAQLPTTIVVPTVGRSSLDILLDRLDEATGPRPADVIVIRDSAGDGPAAARNRGWRMARTPWVSFLDDDVVPDDDWLARLHDDLEHAEADVGGIQGRVSVPLPENRRPTDWERTTAGLQDARWITADMSYRRSALAAVGGFDERFHRAYREDADLALRVMGQGWRLTRGSRHIVHPVRPSDPWVSVRSQAGNGDDVLMRRRHGPDWRERAQAPRGRRSRHVATTAAAAAATALTMSGHPRLAAVPAAGWLAGTAEFAAARISPGPRDRHEIATMLLTSAIIPPAATWHTLRGLIRHHGAPAWRGAPDLVLFDRDGTLIDDVPYNGDPELVRPLPEASAALDRLRAAGVRVGVITNQSGVGRGRFTTADLGRVNERVEQELGPFDSWQVCPHDPADGCFCRKPAPGMVKAACAELGVDVTRCVVVGDIASDMAAAESAGATGILVPNSATRPDETADARRVATDLSRAADAVLGGAW